MNTSSRLTIFEGPDGAGKTTIAKAYAEATGARYVHFNALPRIKKGIGRVYVEAMLPALLGYQDVVFDRSWLSEMPYGVVYREGYERLTQSSKRMLERLAMRCGAVVVKCDPPWKTIRENFLARLDEEMLDNDQQLQEVYHLYREQGTSLPTLRYDYTAEDCDFEQTCTAIESWRMERHPLDLLSAGNWNAGTALVGESFAEQKDQDSFYQWPFGSFSDEGCSQWLTTQLEEAKIPESSYFWINADQPLRCLQEMNIRLVVALGNAAFNKVMSLNLRKFDVEVVPHPQAFKRFHANKVYPLLDLLSES